MLRSMAFMLDLFSLISGINVDKKEMIVLAQH